MKKCYVQNFDNNSVNDTKWKHKSSWTTIEHCENFNRIVGKFLKTGLKREKRKRFVTRGMKSTSTEKQYNTTNLQLPALVISFFFYLAVPLFAPSRISAKRQKHYLINKITVVLGLFTNAVHFVLRDRRIEKVSNLESTCSDCKPPESTLNCLFIFIRLRIIRILGLGVTNKKFVRS